MMAMGALQVGNEQVDAVQAHQEADGCDTCWLEVWTAWVQLWLNILKFFNGHDKDCWLKAVGAFFWKDQPSHGHLLWAR